MSIHHLVSRMLVITLLGTACSSTQDTAANGTATPDSIRDTRGGASGHGAAVSGAFTRSGAAHEVPVIGSDYAFNMPDTVDPGRTAFAFTNRGKVPHEYNIALLKRGVTLRQFIDAANRGEITAPLTDGPVGVLFAAPGRTSASVLSTDLLPGRTYAVQCIFRDADSVPTHRELGMFRAVVVRDGAIPSTPVVMVDTIVGNDYAYPRYPKALAPGWHHFVFVNTGKQRHEINVSLLKPGVTLRQVLDPSPDFDPTTVVDEELGVLHARPGIPSLGTLDFEVLPGRQYVLVCTFQDTPKSPPHFVLGMAASIISTR